MTAGTFSQPPQIHCLLYRVPLWHSYIPSTRPFHLCSGVHQKNFRPIYIPHAWKIVFFEYFFTRVPTSLINIKAKISHSTYLYSYQGSFMRWSRESFEGERIKIRFLKLLILLIILCRNMRTIISVHDVFIFVHFSMLAQSRVWYITLSTDIARKRSFASMQANMSYQRWIAFEGFVAIFADKWPFIYRFLV